MTVAYLQGWMLFQAILTILALQFLGGWKGAVGALFGSLIYLLWNNLQ